MPLHAAHYGALIADAHAMPAHWYYDRAAIDRDFPDLASFQAPREVHPDSILWRSKYQPINERGDILGSEAEAWGKMHVHYHRHLRAGENTVNFKLARDLYERVGEFGNYDPERWANHYVSRMLNPEWHRDTYLEEYHRGFFTRYAQGKPILKCGIRDEHIGGLAHVPALVAALAREPLETVRSTVKTHVTLTHRHSNVLRAADCLTRLLRLIEAGTPLRDAIMQGAGDWFSTKKAIGYAKRGDREIIGSVYSPACYIDQSFPAALYLAWRYHDDFQSGVIANTSVGGDNCHRGAVVGALLAAEAIRSGAKFDPACFGELHIHAPAFS